MNNYDYASAIEDAFKILGFGLNMDETNEKIDANAKKTSDCAHECANKKEYMTMTSKGQFKETITDEKYTLVMSAYGHDENDIVVNVNPSKNCLEIGSILNDDDKWYVAHIDGRITLPQNIQYDTLTKCISDGVLYITGSFCKPQVSEPFQI